MKPDTNRLRRRYGHSLVQFDPAAERKLRLKIDLMIIPTVALLYLFCFIDRANIGKRQFSSPLCDTLEADYSPNQAMRKLPA